MKKAIFYFKSIEEQLEYERKVNNSVIKENINKDKLIKDAQRLFASGVGICNRKTF